MGWKRKSSPAVIIRNLYVTTSPWLFLILHKMEKSLTNKKLPSYEENNGIYKNIPVHEIWTKTNSRSHCLGRKYLNNIEPTEKTTVAYYLLIPWNFLSMVQFFFSSRRKPFLHHWINDLSFFFLKRKIIKIIYIYTYLIFSICK